MLSPLHIGLVGASGAVGTELIHLFEKRNFPLRSLKCFGSKRSQGKKILFQQEEIPIEALTPSSFQGLDLVFFSAGSQVSKVWVPLALEQGVLVIDNSSAFRQDPDVPLVIPEVNPHLLKNKSSSLIANPNCATILLLMALAPLHRYAKLKRVIVSTYQAASGAGLQAMKELQEETLAVLENRPYLQRTIMPHPYAFNLFLHNSPLKEHGYLEEELKILYETQKILEDSTIQVGATCIRVPVLRAHAEAINAEFHAPISSQEATKILLKSPGIRLVKQAMPLEAAGQEEVLCGRIREDRSLPNTLDLWVVGDQLLKGAALNAIQIAECIRGIQTAPEPILSTL